MANIVANLEGALGFDLNLYFLGGVEVRSDTRFSQTNDTTFTNYNGNYAIGSIGEDVVTSGTVNGISLRMTDADGKQITMAQIYQVGADAALVWDMADLGEQASLFDLIFSKADTFTGSKFADNFSSFAGDDSLFGAEGKDLLAGGDGNDTLNGGAARDTLSGGAGDDAYYTERQLDTVVEDLDGGIDTVYARSTMSLAANVENLTLLGTGTFTGKGNELGNVLLGNGAANQLQGLDGNDWLNGFAGADILIGGLGDDYYEAVDLTDEVREFADGGIDTVKSSVALILAANIENLRLGDGVLEGTGNTEGNYIVGNELGNAIAGVNGSDTLDGGAGNDSLTGGASADVLIGNLGADTMVGNGGDDVFYVDASADSVVEAVNGGNDAVLASVSYTLGSEVERLVLNGTGNFNATGNAGDNVLMGNAGNNVLDGRGGNDTASYEFATDRVVVNLYLTGDQFTRAGGTDRLVGIENLTGGSGDDHLIGNAGNNVLDGGFGVDTLVGGLGNDVLVVDNESDIATEWKHEGVDEVVASISWAIDPAIENLTLTGIDDVFGYGNSQNSGAPETGTSDTNGNNVITGNDGNNVLRGYNPDQTAPEGVSVGQSSGADTISGGNGDDTIGGGDGNDSLSGGAGNDLLGSGPTETGNDIMSGGEGDDTFVFNSTLGDGNTKTLTDFDIDGDVLSLDVAIFTELADRVGEDQWVGHWASEAFRIVQDVDDTSSFDPLDDLLLYEQPTGELYYNRDGVGSLQRIAFMPAGLYLSDANFELFAGTEPGP